MIEKISTYDSEFKSNIPVIYIYTIYSYICSVGGWKERLDIVLS